MSPDSISVRLYGSAMLLLRRVLMTYVKYFEEKKVAHMPTLFQKNFQFMVYSHNLYYVLLIICYKRMTFSYSTLK